MKRRATKWAALLVSGGLLLQWTACIPLIADLLLRPVVLNVIRSALDGATNGDTDTNGDNPQQ